MVSAISSGIVFVLLIIQNVLKNEQQIQQKQIQFCIQLQNSNSNQHLMFPICIDKNPNPEDNFNANIPGYDPVPGFWRSISVHDWFLLFCILIANASMFAIEAILAVYYTVFVSDLYPEDKDIVMIATLQIAVYCATFIFGVQIVPKLLELGGFHDRMDGNYHDFKFEYGVLVILQAIMVVVHSIGWSNVEFMWFWVFHMIGGFIMGVVNMVQESILLKLQPNKFAGTIAGMKQFGRYTMKAVGCLVVGMLWDRNVFYWAYIQSILYFVGLICTLLMVIASLKRINKRYKIVISDVSDIYNIDYDANDM